MLKKKGLIWDIQRFNLHDGQGIRTLVFFKGCPLQCLWCSNPEGQKNSPEIRFIENRCQKCGRCKEICPEKSISWIENKYPQLNRVTCTICKECVNHCLTKALLVNGHYMLVEEIMATIQRDYAFYHRSGGGITLSGGEPTQQLDFAIQTLKEARERNIHTAIETCGYIGTKKLARIIPYTNTFLIDLKHMDQDIHKKLTGVNNEVIIKNIEHLASVDPSSIILRTPIIPNLNDGKNLERTALFAKRLNISRWDLLPYHNLGKGKYKEIGSTYRLSFLDTPEDFSSIDLLVKLKKIFNRTELEGR